MSELPYVRTHVTPVDMFTAVGEALWSVLGSQPRRESVVCLVAQWQVENGSEVTCNNVANQRHPAGSDADYVVYPYCSEIEKDGHEHWYARDEAAAASLRARGHAATVAPGRCQFAAYRTLAEGAAAYLALLRKPRYAKAWAVMLTGDPALFSHELHAGGWYTASESSYTRRMVQLFRVADATLPAA